MKVFSATVTRYLGDPTKPPPHMGQMYLNPVEPKSAKKLLSAVEEINAEIEQGTVKKRKLRKL